VDVEGRNGHFDAFAVGRQKVEAHQEATYREKRVHDYESVQQNHRVQPLIVLQNYIQYSELEKFKRNTSIVSV
jgi:hypothetical protein